MQLNCSIASLFLIYSTSFAMKVRMARVCTEGTQYRRQRARLSLFYKSLHNLIALEIPPYYISNNHLSRLRIHHQLSYIYPYARTNTYKYSFFPRTISEWNSLPTEIILSTTLSAFQSQLDSYLHHLN